MKRLRRDQRGSVVVETALVVPLLLVLVLGCVEIVEILRVDMKLRQAAQTLANLVAAQASVNAAAIANFCTGAQLVMTPFAASPLAGAVVEIGNSATGSVAVAWQNTSCGNAAPVADAVALATPLVPNPGDSVILVQATYVYTAFSTYVLPAEVTLTRIAYARPRNVASVAAN